MISHSTETLEKFTNLINNLQLQLNDLSNIYANHPDQNRFAYALVYAINSLGYNPKPETTFKEKFNKELDLLIKSNDTQLDIFDLAQNNLKELPHLDAPSPLLHTDKLTKLIETYDELCAISKNNATLSANIKTLKIIKYLYLLNTFNSHLMNSKNK